MCNGRKVLHIHLELPYRVFASKSPNLREANESIIHHQDTHDQNNFDISFFNVQLEFKMCLAKIFYKRFVDDFSDEDSEIRKVTRKQKVRLRARKLTQVLLPSFDVQLNDR